jgi:hypothetical protein
MLLLLAQQMADDDAADKQDCVNRNVEHLEIMVAKDFWTTEEHDCSQCRYHSREGLHSMSESNVVTIAGKEYEESNLDDQQMYLINQIRDLQAKAASLRFQLDQVQAAQDVFTNGLIASVEESDEDEVAIAN